MTLCDCSVASYLSSAVPYLGHYQYWGSPRYGTPNVSYQVVEQACIDTQPKTTKLWFYFHVKVDKNANPLIFFLSKKTKFWLFPFSWVVRSNAHDRHTQILSLGRCFKLPCLGKHPIVGMTKIVLHHHGIEPTAPPCSPMQPKSKKLLHHSTLALSSSLIIYDQLPKMRSTYTYLNSNILNKLACVSPPPRPEVTQRLLKVK